MLGGVCIFALSLRAWATLCLDGEELPLSQTGKHAKRRSYLQDEDCILPFQEYLPANKFKVEVSALTEHVNMNILPGLRYAPSSTISERTATRWLHSLDIKYRIVTKGIYIDGHEREDVIAYRQHFLERMADLKAWIPTIVGKEEVDGNNEFIAITWSPDGIRPFILVTHDESTFAAHDGLKRLWLPDGKQPLRKKGQGRFIHVSDFLCNIIGWLALDEEKAAQHPDLQAAACIIMQPDTQHYGWWTSDKLCKQVCDLAIPIFEAQFPGCQALFAFYKATGDSAFAPDASLQRNELVKCRQVAKDACNNVGTRSLSGFVFCL